MDADSRNIEEIEVEADETRYRPRKTEQEMKALEDAGYKFKEYDGLIPDMENGTAVLPSVLVRTSLLTARTSGISSAMTFSTVSLSSLSPKYSAILRRDFAVAD